MNKIYLCQTIEDSYDCDGDWDYVDVTHGVHIIGEVSFKDESLIEKLNEVLKWKIETYRMESEQWGDFLNQELNKISYHKNKTIELKEAILKKYPESLFNKYMRCYEEDFKYSEWDDKHGNTDKAILKMSREFKLGWTIDEQTKESIYDSFKKNVLSKCPYPELESYLVGYNFTSDTQFLYIEKEIPKLF